MLHLWFPTLVAAPEGGRSNLTFLWNFEPRDSLKTLVCGWAESDESVTVWRVHHLHWSSPAGVSAWRCATTTRSWLSLEALEGLAEASSQCLVGWLWLLKIHQMFMSLPKSGRDAASFFQRRVVPKWCFVRQKVSLDFNSSVFSSVVTCELMSYLHVFILHRFRRWSFRGGTKQNFSRLMQVCCLWRH